MKILIRVFLASSFVCVGSLELCASDEPKAAPPPKELVQYVRDAAKLGLNDGEIERNAAAAGWSGALVKTALAAMKTAPENAATPQEPASSPASGSSATSATPAVETSAAPEPAAPTPSVDRPKAHGVPEDYRIGEGDVLQISVYKEPDASVPNAVVLPGGQIAMPLIKRIQAAGLTAAELEKAVTEQLTKFIPGADVTVVVSGVHSKRIYVVGAVKKEGPIAYTYRMTVMQALSEAGGLTDYAKRKKIYVLRTENGKEARLPFDYDAALRGERMQLNVPLLPNDTLVVPH